MTYSPMASSEPPSASLAAMRATGWVCLPALVAPDVLRELVNHEARHESAARVIGPKMVMSIDAGALGLDGGLRSAAEPGIVRQLVLVRDPRPARGHRLPSLLRGAWSPVPPA